MRRPILIFVLGWSPAILHFGLHGFSDCISQGTQQTTTLKENCQSTKDAIYYLCCTILYNRTYSALSMVTYRVSFVSKYCQVRIIFRLIEYASGFKSSIPNHEAFLYCFDLIPMFIALLLLNTTHPGAVMPGKESDLPSRKERKLRKLNEHELLTSNSSPQDSV